MHTKAHCYWYWALLCTLGMVLFKLCAQRAHSAQYAPYAWQECDAVICQQNIDRTRRMAVLALASPNR